MQPAAHESRGDRSRKKSKARLNGEAKEDSLPASRVDSKAAPGALEDSDKKPKNWASDIESDAYAAAEKLYPLIFKEYENQSEQGDRVGEYWAIYNATPDANLMYAGNSQGYVPAVRDAINARTKRTLRQLFPVNHKHVDGVSAEGREPHTQLAMLEHYIRKTRLKSIVRSDLVAGDVTGQWGLTIDWSKSIRRVTELVKRNPIVDEIDGEDVRDLGIEDPLSDEDEETEEHDVTEEGPEIIDFAVEDLAVIPPTENNLQRAKAVCLKLRYSKERFQEAIDEGCFVLPDGKTIDEFFLDDQAKDKHNREKEQTNDAGIKTQGTNKFALLYMVYTKLDLGEKRKASALVYYGGPKVILGILKNPLWSGKIPILSEPVERVKGSFFGKSKIEPVKFLQWQLCDFWNMGQDSAMYSLLPIFNVDPLKSPQWQMLVMGLAAVWPVGPNDVGTIKMPQLWKDSAGICDLIKRQIWESMDVNEMMMGKMPAGRKNNQLMGQMQQEQSTNINDHAERYEEVMLNPLVELLFEFDQQFRTEAVTIESRGEIGVKAAVEEIPPQQWGERYFFRWSGTAFQMNMQRMQQQIAWVNVLKGIPPQLLGGKRLDLSPMAETGTENMFGPELAPRILVDERNMFTIDPDTENQIMHNGMPVEVHEADNDMEHIQAHMRGAELTGDPMGLYKAHLGTHMLAVQKKREKAQAQQGGLPGAPGGAGPGVPGAPRPGAQPAPGGPRPAQNPPGAIGADAMPGQPGRG